MRLAGAGLSDADGYKLGCFSEDAGRAICPGPRPENRQVDGAERGVVSFLGEGVHLHGIADLDVVDEGNDRIHRGGHCQRGRPHGLAGRRMARNMENIADEPNSVGTTRE